ncbi:AMP-binding protein [Alphaproteobacteria bacterium]|nr:AMP-binding protein [Alphaproteobacteria bacterium]
MTFLKDAFLTLRGVIKYHSFLKNSQFYNDQSISKQQNIWLREYLIHACENIPWYMEKFKRYGVNPYSEKAFLELEKFPILTKSEVIENHAKFFTAGANKSALTFFTSGTTGQPMRAFSSENQWVIEQGLIWRQWKWAGYKFRDKIATFRSYSPTLDEPKIVVNRLKNWAYFSVFDMTDEDLDGYFSFLQVWRPKFIRGYPSALSIVAKYAQSKSLRIASLKAVFCASETTTHELRKLVREALGVEIFDHYGQAEITAMFHDCELHSGMHVDWEYGFVELLPTKNPNLKRVIATNLHNTAMPLLRYDTGDLVFGSWKKCPCGRGAPIVSQILGRNDDFIFTSDMSEISTVNLYTYFAKIVELDRFQIIQNVPGNINIIVRINANTPDGQSKQICQKIRHDLELKTKLAVTVESDCKFLQSREGKFVTLVQRVKHDC